MKYYYPTGTVRAFHWHGKADVRSYRSPKGWVAHAELTDVNPVTNAPLERAIWWIIETKTET